MQRIRWILLVTQQTLHGGEFAFMSGLVGRVCSLAASAAFACWLLPSHGMAHAQDVPAAPGPDDACTYLSADDALQYLGLVVTEIVPLPGGCALRTADGSHSAANAVRDLNGHDGVLIGIAPGQTQMSPRCQQQSIPDVPSPGGVCLTGDLAVVGFDLDNGRAAVIQIYASSPPSLDGVDAIAALAYPRMN